MCKKISFAFLTTLILAIVISCGTKNEDTAVQKRKAKGPVSYGGYFRFQSPQLFESLNPLEITNPYTRNITFQIFENLLRIDTKTMRPEPNLAKTITLDPTGKIYTLTIRDSVFFHDDPAFQGQERKLTVQDVKFSLEMACSNLPVNKAAFLLSSKIKGAKTFFNRSKRKMPKAGVPGIRVVNDSTLQIELVEPFSGFKEILAHPNLAIIAPEIYQAYGNEMGNHPVGTGPFCLKTQTDYQIELSRNERYWKRDKWSNRLPYLDGILVRFSDNKKNELNDFQSEKLDCVLDIPVDQINYLLGSLQDAQKGENVMHKVLSEPSMSMMFIGFACQSKEFSDVRVRRAFNMVVDRNLVVNQYLSGEGWPAKNGFIPPLDFFPNEDVQPLENNIEEARSLMSEAGYPNGKNFPELEVYVNGVIGDPNYNMTKGVIDQINEKLGTKIKVKVCTAKERDQAVASGKAKMWRAGWIADYPNPESFMSLFYSRNINKSNSTINSFRFRNQEFDAIFEQANKEQDETIRNQLFALCDQIIVNEGVVIPVLTEDFIVFLNDRVKNFEPNSLEILDFSNTFIRPY